MSDSLAPRFHMLFAGLERAHGVCIPIDGTREDGKREATSFTKREPVTEDLWVKHLAGEQGLGIIVIREDSTVTFGAIDVDVYADLNHGGIAAEAARLELPIVPCRSKSGGVHLYMFSTPVPAPLMQAKLREVATLLGFGKVEIFPKQEKSGDLGSWINMPYFNGDATTRYAIKANGDPMAMAEFLSHAENLRVGPESFQKDGGSRKARQLLEQAVERLATKDRNDTGFWYACQLRDLGLDKNECAPYIREWVRCANEALPKNGDRYTLGEANASLNSAFKRAPREPEPGKGNNTAKVLEDLSKDIELFHSPKGEAFGLVPVNDHVECWAVDSRVFKGILTSRYFKRQNSTPGRDALQSFVDLLCARARFDAPEKLTYLRLAHADGRAYLDLANDSWQVVEIDADGWRIRHQSPVCFRRTAGMKPLPIPEQGGSLTALRRFINAQDDRHFVLMASWLVGTFLPKGAFPVLLIQGVHGSAKSGTTSILRNLVDPATVPLIALPRDERELAIRANNSGVIAFDNVSGLHQWLSDALCRVATGAGFCTRTLHTDSDEQLFEMRRALVLNGIDDIGSRADLLDRSIGVYLGRISDTQRKTDDEVQAEFASAHGSILGALLNAVSTGLRNLPGTRLSSMPRMADFAKWVSACEPALPWAPGTFMRDYLDMRQKAAELSVENDMVAQALLRMVQSTRSNIWEGTSEELLAHLNQRVPSERRDVTTWPKTPASLGRWLRRAEPSLLAVGVLLSARRGGKERTRLLRVEYRDPEQPKLIEWPEPDAA